MNGVHILGADSPNFDIYNLSSKAKNVTIIGNGRSSNYWTGNFLRQGKKVTWITDEEVPMTKLLGPQVAEKISKYYK